jgi:ubiquinone/menaquinone biosynthesis C-methylase UbiE
MVPVRFHLSSKEVYVSKRICPWWLGYFLISPLRRLWYDPAKFLAPFVKPGMTVLEPGPGMGFLTLELARLVGPSGRVVAVDIQPKMLDRLRKRAEKAGLIGRLDTRLAKPNGLGVEDMDGKVDFVLAFAMVHEVEDKEAFFREVGRALKPGGKVLLSEPKGHVNKKDFAETVEMAVRSGFAASDGPKIRSDFSAVLEKQR